MLVHEVQPGECLASIAKAAGFSNWKTLYRHADNAALRESRPNPNLLAPGDKVVIPEMSRRDEDAASENIHKFKRRTHRVRLRIAILDEKWQPAKGRRYALTVAGQKYQGTLDDQGILEHPKPDEEAIAVDAEEGTLEVDGGDSPSDGVLKFKLLIGHLGPPDGTWGVRARLSNIGLSSGSMSDPPNDRLTAALNLFRARSGLATRQENTIDKETSDRLRTFHDHERGSKAG